jgi:hypothetical protein
MRCRSDILYTALHRSSSIIATSWTEACHASTAGLKLYLPSNLPTCWVVEDATGNLWTVPASDHGWKRRHSYRGSHEFLQQVDLAHGYGLGLPIGVPLAKGL